MIKRLKEKLEIYNSREDLKHKLSLSMGVTFYNPQQSISLDSLIAQADTLMYKQKRTKHKA